MTEYFESLNSREELKISFGTYISFSFSLVANGVSNFYFPCKLAKNHFKMS